LGKELVKIIKERIFLKGAVWEEAEMIAKWICKVFWRE